MIILITKLDAWDILQRQRSDNVNNFDVAGLLKSYSEKVANARNDEHLKQLVRDLKNELNSKEIRKMVVIK